MRRGEKILIAVILLAAILDGPAGPVLRAEPISLTAILVSVAVSAAVAGVNALVRILNPQKFEVNRADVQVQKSVYGADIPRVYGTAALAGTIIWQSPIRDITTKKKQGKGKASVTTHSYNCDFQILLAEGVYKGISRVWADTKLLAAPYIPFGTNPDGYTFSLPGRADLVYVHLGHETQSPNPWHEEDKGYGNVPAYRGYLSVAFRRFIMDEWGNRLPNLRFEVVRADNTTVEVVVQAEAALVGLSADQINASTLTDTVDGYIIASRQQSRQVLEELARAYQFDAAEYDGKINFVKRAQNPVISLSADELGAYEVPEGDDGSRAPARLNATVTQSFEVSKGFAVGFLDAAREYEPTVQEFRRAALDNADIGSANFNLVMTPAYANKLARIFTVTAQTERVPIGFSLLPKYLYLTPTDVIEIETAQGNTIEVRLTRIETSAAGVILCQAVRQVREAYDQVGIAESGLALPSTTIKTPCDTHLTVLRKSEYEFRSAVETVFGFWAAGTCNEESDSTEWRGATLYRQVDRETGTYQEMARIALPATKGTTLTVLPLGESFNVTDFVEVDMRYGVPQSISDEVFRSSSTENLALIGREVLQYRDVTPLGGDKYRLSYFKRGLKGTDQRRDGHAIGEEFLLLDEAVYFVPLEREEEGIQFDYLAVTDLQSITDVTFGDPGYVSGFAA